MWINAHDNPPSTDHERIIVWDNVIDDYAICQWDYNDWIEVNTSNLVVFDWWFLPPDEPEGL